jgi:hypothetical protein
MSKDPWEMTMEEYARNCGKNVIIETSIPFEMLEKETQDLATFLYRQRFGDLDGLKNFFFNRRTGEVSGEDYYSHRQEIAQALSEGLPVPPEVLKDYPELRPGQ